MSCKAVIYQQHWTQEHLKKRLENKSKPIGLKYTNVWFGRGLKCSPRTDHNSEFHKCLILVCLCPQQINEEKSSALKGVDLIIHTDCVSLISLCLAGHSKLPFPHCRCHSSVFKLQSCLLHREHVASWGASFFLRANWYKISTTCLGWLCTHTVDIHIYIEKAAAVWYHSISFAVTGSENGYKNTLMKSDKAWTQLSWQVHDWLNNTQDAAPGRIQYW